MLGRCKIFSVLSVRSLEGGPSAFTRKVRHYKEAFSHLDFGQLTQIVQDKFDPEHSIRRRLASKKPATGQANFSFTHGVYQCFPHCCGLCCAFTGRTVFAGGSPTWRKISLAPKQCPDDFSGRLFRTNRYRRTYWVDREMGETAKPTRFPRISYGVCIGSAATRVGLIRWGVAARNAWIRLFESENIAGCLSADDVNPYTSLPLFIATQRNIPALAVHHGATDSRMAVKPLIADFYLAKGELERDYLLNTCRADPERIVMAGPRQILPRPSCVC